MLITAAAVVLEKCQDVMRLPLPVPVRSTLTGPVPATACRAIWSPYLAPIQGIAPLATIAPSAKLTASVCAGTAGLGWTELPAAIHEPVFTTEVIPIVAGVVPTWRCPNQ